MQDSRLIITAASEPFADSLIALLGSLDANWPAHPRVLVYDIGLNACTVARLDACAIAVKPVPAFCPHWRDHYTWKLWCLCDAPAVSVVWMDATIAVLQPLDELFDAVETLGYFFTGNGELLDWEASDEACRGCQVSPESRLGKPTLAATFMGFRKEGRLGALLDEALAVALTERHIEATTIAHRHDQAILSLLAYRELGRVLLADRAIYLHALLPQAVAGQKVWHHRRRLLPQDAAGFGARLSGETGPYRPTPPCSMESATAQAALYRVHWYYGRQLPDEAAGCLRRALAADPALLRQPLRLARTLLVGRQRLRPFLGDRAAGQFVPWGVTEIRAAAGDRIADQIQRRLTLAEAPSAR